MDARKFVSFQELVWTFYQKHGRHDLPWRTSEVDGSFDPYKILVSEVMLQQTQVLRVIPKYQEFLAKFPDVDSLVRAELGGVLATWNGLGYNRRAKFLWQAAQMIDQDFGGKFPDSRAKLEALPGVGPNTAGAILAYAFDQPAAFVETNIRTVFIHHFFKDQTGIPDKEILSLVAKTLPDEKGKEQEWLPQSGSSDLFRKRRREKPSGLSRLWYWALMDYGSYLKQTVGNMSRASKSYSRQSKFTGSNRQLRGQVIRRLLAGPAGKKALEIFDDRLEAVLVDLVDEGLIRKVGQTYSLFAREKTVLK